MKYSLLVLLFYASSAASEVLFQNSVVSNDIDFITTSDPTVPSVLTFETVAKREMPDKRSDELFDSNAFVFKAQFEDETKVEIWVHSDFGAIQAAEVHARMLLKPLGRLPSYMRMELSHIVLHQGNETAYAEHLGKFFVLYSENVLIRINNNDLEETLFHESVHATLDAKFSKSAAWLDAQANDRFFVTQYANDYPAQEDLAETALFVYTYRKHPGRLPAAVERWLTQNIPNRIQFLQSVFTDLRF